MTQTTIGAGLMVFGSLLAFAQEFEVASIKPSDPNERRIMMRGGPGQSNFTGVTLKLLLQQAYDVRDFQISGGPAWAGSDRYDVVAKLPADEPPLPADPTKITDVQQKTFQQRRQAMLQALLGDRFQLKIHRDTKELPVYFLTAAKSGPKLKDNGGKVADPNMKPGMMRISPGMLTGSQQPMQFLVQILSQIMGRTVLDQTGLSGRYDFELRWTPDQSTAGGLFAGGPPPGPPPPGAELPPPPDPNGPTLFTALQEQLGLKLDSGKGPVGVIVIDHAEKPSEN